MIVYHDLETELIRPGKTVPDIICAAWQTPGFPITMHQVALGELSADAAQVLFQQASRIVGHNIAFDMACWANYIGPGPIFDLYDRGAVRCTMLAQKMLDLYLGKLQARGGYSLDALAERYKLGALDKGGDSWRLRYAELKHLPIDQWPQRAVDYAKGDVEILPRLVQAQANECAINGTPDDLWDDLPKQCSAAFAYQLMGAWGMVTDPKATKELRERYETAFGKVKQKLTQIGFIVKGKRSAKAIGDYIKKNVPDYERTATGAPSTAKDSLAQYNDPKLAMVSEYISLEKSLSTYVSVIEQGCHGLPIQPKYINTMLESGRASASENYFTLPREGGFRECYVPRPGHVFCSCDYDSAELRTLAQVCLDMFGKSNLAQLYQDNPDADPHSWFAAKMLGVELGEFLPKKKTDPAYKEARQKAKAANYGFPGGMGVDRFIAEQAKTGQHFTRAEAKRLRESWLSAFPEMQRYFAHINDVVSTSGRFKTVRSGRYRGGVGYCDGANSYFQSLAADGAKRALYNLMRECYAVPDSPLYGSRVVNFPHDESLLELPEDRAHEAAIRVGQIMVEGLQYYCPDVPITATPALMRRWYKDAEPVTKDGKLIPWEPKRS